MDISRLLIRAKQWARHPPPMWKVWLVLGVIAACLLIVGFEAIWGWPEAFEVNRRHRP